MHQITIQIYYQRNICNLFLSVKCYVFLQNVETHKHTLEEKQEVKRVWYN